MNEIWSQFRDFNYMVSTLGRVKNSSGKIIKDNPKNKHSKYRRIHLSKNGKKFYFFVHRLVWEAFNGPIPEGYQVNHIDENPENNCLSNLNLLTPKENSNYGNRPKNISERQMGKNNSFYDKHPSSFCIMRTKETHNKPVIQYTKDMVFIMRFDSI